MTMSPDDWAIHGPTAERCCDGTGWTGDEHERCLTHFEPLPWPWSQG